MYGNFSNYGFIRAKVPDELFLKLKTEIEELRNSSTADFNSNLAGNIELEYKLEKNKEELETFLVDLARAYNTGWGITNTAKDLRADNLKLTNYWVNLQKKHEFNPIHGHDGAFSFAIWIQVPYDIDDELSTKHVKKSNMPRAGMFSFIYTNIFGEIREAEFPVDRTYEGTIFLFPSCLQHTVYPFSSSDDYRISISGNLGKIYE
jgi:hypothetical protein